ncbi:MAG: AgmX/PglI C-terminal domain-containing protein, partial [Halobacteriales archaeon]|nr:AgmX/PglI C-terminal domain-containing protein [Halobacteriales archaeon]
WHPRWKDEDGRWHDGWGWYDDGGDWQVRHGYYDPRGDWHDVEPVSMTSVTGAFEGEPHLDTRPDDESDEPLPVIGRFDRAPVPYVGVSAGAHALFLILAMTVPDSAGALELDYRSQSDRFVQMALTEMQEEEREVPGWAGDDQPEAEHAKHAGDEGQAGDPEEAETGKRLAVKGPAANEDLEIAKARNEEIARSAGIATQVTSMWAVADRSIGSDAEHALGAIDGSSPGATKGVFGLGVQWDGRGGGGDDWQSLGNSDSLTSGLSGVDRGCRGLKCGKGSGPGIGMPDRKTKVPDPVVLGDPQMTGGLDKEIIKRVVRQHRRELKYCYERELQKDKTLSGELVVKFTITGEGDVISAIGQPGSSLKNASVTQCVTSKIRRWVFP